MIKKNRQYIKIMIYENELLKKIYMQYKKSQ